MILQGIQDLRPLERTAKRLESNFPSEKSPEELEREKIQSYFLEKIEGESPISRTYAQALAEGKFGFYEARRVQQFRTWQRAKQLKRKLLGFCGTKSTKSLDEIARALQEVGGARNSQEAIQRAINLLNSYIEYSPNSRLAFIPQSRLNVGLLVCRYDDPLPKKGHSNTHLF